MLAPKQQKNAGHHPNSNNPKRKPFVLQRKGQNASPEIQEKLKIGKANDGFEKEADSVADQVVSKSETPNVEAAHNASSSQAAPPVQTMKVGPGDLAQRESDSESEAQLKEEEDVQMQSESESESEVQMQEEDSDVQMMSEDDTQAQLMEEEEAQLQSESESESEVQMQEESSITEMGTDESDNVQMQSEMDNAADTEPAIQAKSESSETTQLKVITPEPPKAASPTPPVQLQAETSADEDLQMKEDEEVSDDAESIQMKSKTMDSGEDISSQISMKRGGGSPMDDSVKSEMESGFGYDFTKVRIHTDNAASDLNKSLGARAFTTGNDIFFNEGEYTPDTKEGKHLLAHELTHTIQQGHAGVSIQRRELKPKLVADTYFGGVSGYSFKLLKEAFGSDGSDTANMLLLDQISLIIHVNKDLTPEVLWTQIITDVTQVDGYEAYEILRGTKTLESTELIELEGLEVEDTGDAFDAVDFEEVDFAIKNFSLKRKKKRIEEEKAAESIANNFIRQMEQDIQLLTNDAEESKNLLDSRVSDMILDLQNTVNVGSTKMDSDVSKNINSIKQAGLSGIDEVRQFYFGTIWEIKSNTDKKLAELNKYREEKNAEIQALYKSQLGNIDTLYQGFITDINQLTAGYNAEVLAEANKRYESHKVNGRFRNKTKQYKAEAALNVGREVQAEITEKAQSSIQSALQSDDMDLSDDNKTKDEFQAELLESTGQATGNINGAYRDTKRDLEEKKATDQRAALIVLEDYKIFIDEIVILTIQNQLNNKSVYDESQAAFVESKDSALRLYYQSAVAALLSGQTKFKGRIGSEMENFLSVQEDAIVPKMEDLDAALRRTGLETDQHLEAGRTNLYLWRSRNEKQLSALSSLMKSGYNSIVSDVTSSIESSQLRGTESIETTKQEGISEQKRLRSDHLNAIIFEVGESQTKMDGFVSSYKQDNAQQIRDIKTDLKRRVELFRQEAKKIIDGLDERMDQAESEVWTKKAMRERRPDILRDVATKLVGTEKAYACAKRIKDFHGDENYYQLSKADWSTGVFTLDFIRNNINGMKTALKPYNLTPNEYFYLLWQLDFMFRKVASQSAIDKVDEYTRMLRTTEKKLKNKEHQELVFQKLGPYRSKYTELLITTNRMQDLQDESYNKQLERKNSVQNSHQAHTYPVHEGSLVGLSPDKVKEYGKLETKAAKQQESSRKELQHLYAQHPIFNDEGVSEWRRIEKYDLYKAKTPEALTTLLLSYISERKKNAKEARTTLYDQYGKIDVYSMDKHIPLVLEEYGMYEGTLPRTVIEDAITEKEEAEARIAIFQAILLIVLSIASSGTLTAPAAATFFGGLTLEIYMALEELEKYEEQNALSSVGLSSDPNIIWVLMAFAGALVSAAPLLKAINTTKKAKEFKALLEALDKTGDVPVFRQRLNDLLGSLTKEEADLVTGVLNRSLDNRKAYYDAIFRVRNSSGQAFNAGIPKQWLDDITIIAFEKAKFGVKNYQDFLDYVYLISRVDGSADDMLNAELKTVWRNADESALKGEVKVVDEVVEIPSKLGAKNEDLIWKRVSKLIDNEELNKAIKTGADIDVEVEGVTLLIRYDSPFSGFTNFSENSFVLGKDALLGSREELIKTYFHEVYRLTNSQFSGGVKITPDLVKSLGYNDMQSLISAETIEAATFADEAYKFYIE